jgi:hypothetical protein
LNLFRILEGKLQIFWKENFFKYFGGKTPSPFSVNNTVMMRA